MSGTLHVVATPIGNLDDLSRRAVATLQACDLILAEDTRHSLRLLDHAGIRTPLRSLHEHSSDSVLDAMLERLAQGQDLALISDAGTPLVSDPGFELVRAARAAGIEVIPIPGPSALVAALSVAGLPTDRFCFQGFPPARSGPRKVWFKALRTESATQILYESTHRVADTLSDMAEILGEQRPAFIGREMTKLHEQYMAGTLDELKAHVEAGIIPSRGEFVILVAGAPAQADLDRGADAERLLELLKDELPPSRASRVAAAFTGKSKRRCYEIAERLKSGQG